MRLVTTHRSSVYLSKSSPILSLKLCKTDPPRKRAVAALSNAEIKKQPPLTPYYSGLSDVSTGGKDSSASLTRHCIMVCSVRRSWHFINGSKQDMSTAAKRTSNHCAETYALAALSQLTRCLSIYFTTCRHLKALKKMYWYLKLLFFDIRIFQMYFAFMGVEHLWMQTAHVYCWLSPPLFVEAGQSRQEKVIVNWDFIWLRRLK